MTRIEHTRRAVNGMVCTVDHLASEAGVRMLTSGGNAVDAAVAASAVLAVTTQHMCGMGGDLWALVHEGARRPPATLNSSGRAGSGSDPDRMRAEGHRVMPFRGDIRSVPIPGCVDGWMALLDRYGSLPREQVFSPAIGHATRGFAVSPILAAMIGGVAEVDGADDYLPGGVPAADGQIITRPGLARSLKAIAADGRTAWYEGEFGAGLRRLGDSAGGLYSAADLAQDQAEWVDPVGADAWGHRLWTVPPNSQGYASVAGAVLADGLDLPADPSDPLWGHLLIECAKQAAFDRAEVLHQRADGTQLVSENRLGPRRQAISAENAAPLVPPAAAGGTIYLCVVDANGMGVSLMQSNAAGFGAHVAVPDVGVFLQNRGIGFSLEAGHPAELAGGRKPPSTLAPAMITTTEGDLRTVFGTMGGDGQPQVVLQMAARLLQAEIAPGPNLSAPRFTLTVPDAAGFDTWDKRDQLIVAIETGSGWAEGLSSRGHEVLELPWGIGLFGHAHMIDVRPDHLAGCADPRALIGSALGH